MAVTSTAMTVGAGDMNRAFAIVGTSSAFCWYFCWYQQSSHSPNSAESLGNSVDFDSAPGTILTSPDMALIEVTPEERVLREVAPGPAPSAVEKAAGAPLRIAEDCRERDVPRACKGVELRL
ncbi:MAG: hypothetical protein KGJ66_11480 [Alphaproteobacteria bacterium]|nr:hypothetical protein [Alphaproteobacteria bacterium]